MTSAFLTTLNRLFSNCIKYKFIRVIRVNSFYIKPKIILKKITFVFTLYISDFFNTARESAEAVARMCSIKKMFLKIS